MSVIEVGCLPKNSKNGMGATEVASSKRSPDLLTGFYIDICAYVNMNRTSATTWDAPVESPVRAERQWSVAEWLGARGGARPGQAFRAGSPEINGIRCERRMPGSVFSGFCAAW